MEIWVFILTLWAFARWIQMRVWKRKDDERFERVIDALNRGEKKIETLERRIRELEMREIAIPAKTQEPVPAPAAAIPPKPVELPSPVRIPPWPTEPKETPPQADISRPAATTPPKEPIKTPEPVVRPKPLPTPPTHVVPRATHVPQAHPPAPPTPPLPPSARPSAPPPRQASAREISSDLEQKLGTNWLNKIGITILVIGISLFLAIKFPSLTNPEKIGLGYVVSLLILGSGAYLEKKERYRIFGRALIGGGWALTFFATYAMHFVPYTRVIETQWVDLVLLFIVAAVMVVHTLRYDSQVVTGLAFLLALTTVTISQNTIYSLSAGVILALGLVAIVHRRSWFELEIFGILASYLNHFVWLTQVVIPISGRHRIFPEFVPSCVLLCLYWAVYRWSYVARKIERDSQEAVSTVAAILNTSLLLLLFKYQSVHPEWAFYALLILGAVELAIGQLPVLRQRRAAFAILSGIGTVLLVAAIPFKYSGLDTAIIWLAEAQILLIAGVVVREQLFRIFGFLVALLTAGDMLLNQGAPELLPTMPKELAPFALATKIPDYQLGLSFLVAAGLFYVNALLIPRRWKKLVTTEAEETFYRGLTYLGAAMLFVGLGLAFSHWWMAVAWAAAALGLLMVSRWISASDLTVQTHLFAFGVVVRTLLVNLASSGGYLYTGLTARLVTVALIIALLYLCARWLSMDQKGTELEFSEVYTTAAALLVMLLAYDECNWAWIGIAWGAFALILAALGFYRERADFGWQAHAIVLAAFTRTLMFNIDATREYGHFTLRLITFTLMAALLYLNAYFSGPRDSASARLFSAIHTFAGSLMLAMLAFLEVSSPWIAVSWALFAFLLLVIGDRLKREELHVQAYILSGLTLFQIFTVNTGASQPFRWVPSVSVRMVTMVIVAGLFYLSGRWAARGEFISGAALVGAAYEWTGSAIVLVLLHFEMYQPTVALGWAIFGVVLFELGMWRRSANWRMQGYASLGLAFVRVCLLNLSNASSHDLLVYTLPTAAAFYYVYGRLRLGGRESAKDFAVDAQIQAAPVLAYLGSATLTLLAMSFQMGPSLIAWSVLALALIAIAWFTLQDVFLHQSVLLALLVFLRAIPYEFFTRLQPTVWWFSGRWEYVAAACAILFACQAFAFPLRSRIAETEEQDGISRVVRRPEQVYFFVPMLLTMLMILQEVSTGRVTIAWGIEAVAAFLFALVVGERSYRLAGLSLLLGCVAKIVLLDVWRQQRADRYITFIILGVALLLVSFLYTRYSEAIHRYL